MHQRHLLQGAQHRVADLQVHDDGEQGGGLLMAVPEERASAFVRALEGRDTLAAVVGEVVESQAIRVVP